MKKLWAFARHNSGIVIGCILAIAVLGWVYGCQSQVTSIVNPTVLVTRGEFELEVDKFLAQQKLKVDIFIAQAELKVADLDKQDLIKDTIFNTAVNFMQGGQVNPAAVAIVIGNILGLGAILDNVRKRTLIETMKSERENS